MVSRLLVILGSLLVVNAALAQPAPGGRAASARAWPHAGDRFLVRFQAADCDRLPECWPEARAALREQGVVRLTPLVPRRGGPPRPLDRLYVAHLAAGAELPKLAALEALPGVDYAEPDYAGHGAARIPNDPDFDLQWGFQQPSDADVDATLAWALEVGSESTVIAILDTGVAMDNPDLVPALLGGYDVVNDDARPMDDHGHGTNIAGLAAARGFNGVGIAGLCPTCALLPIKVLDEENFGYYSWWIQGIELAVERGADIINLSLGGRAESRSLLDAIRLADARGVLLVAAMMNNGERLDYYPAIYAETLAVGATNEQDARAATFSWGGGSNFGEHIDIVAPGTSMAGPDGFAWSGTSQATAMVSGAAGLLLSAQPSLSAAELRDLLIETAEDRVGPAHEDSEGFDIYYGHGRLNAYRALYALGVYEDADGDGYAQHVDCDDGDPEIHPEAGEIPGNDVDEDCDPRTRDSDLDGDGVPPPRDCDDTRASVNPDAEELPGNGLDDDCDPSTSDGDSDICVGSCGEDVAEVAEPPPGGGGDDEGCCAVLAPSARERSRRAPVGLLLIGVLLLGSWRRR